MELSCPISGCVPPTPKRAPPETGRRGIPVRFERDTGGAEILESKSTGDKHPCFFLFHKYQQGGKKNCSRERGR